MPMSSSFKMKNIWLAIAILAMGYGGRLLGASQQPNVVFVITVHVMVNTGRDLPK